MPDLKLSYFSFLFSFLFSFFKKSTFWQRKKLEGKDWKKHCAQDKSYFICCLKKTNLEQTKKIEHIFSSFLPSLLQRTKRVSASRWSWRTTSFRPVWTSRHLRASTHGPTSRTLSDLTAPFCLCDADWALQQRGGEENLVALKPESMIDSSLDVSHWRIDRTALMDQPKRRCTPLRDWTPAADHVWMLLRVDVWQEEHWM